jgi:hypothetical protein
MAQNKRPTARKPATKFPQLQKKLDQSKLRANVKKINVRKSGHK